MEKKETHDPVVEELTLEPRSPGETTAAAFDKSVEASPLLRPTNAGKTDPSVIKADERIVREVQKLRKGGAKKSTKKLIKKLAKEKVKESRPSWRR